MAIAADPPTPAGPKASNQSRAPGETRALLRILAAQSENANPIVAIAALLLVFTMYGRVPTAGLALWSALAIAVGLSRALISRRIGAGLDTASEPRLRRNLRMMMWGTALNSVMMGTAFWLIAAHGDMYVRMIVTLMSLVHMAAVLLYLVPSVTDRLLCIGGNVLQGALFWLGVANSDGPHWELLAVYCGMFWCCLVAGREQLRQFRESLRMRDENAALLVRLERERAAVHAALEEARLANKGKNRFLAAASHDLRQPLHALTMFLGTLGFHVGGDDGKRLLGRATETLRVLEEQFNSLLDLSRFDAGAIVAKPRAFRLDELLRKVCDEFRPQAQAKGITFTLQAVPAMVWSDPLLLGRLLRNLLDNAVHYTIHGRICVRLQPGATGFVLAVDDTGPGIPQDQQAAIFDEYVQLANPARQREHGVGLGLAIVKRIDHLLGLRLQLQSQEGTGSSFIIRVPEAGSGAVEVLPAPLTTDPLSFRIDSRIWLLDDDPIALEGMQAQLEAWGAEVTAFRDPQILLAALRTGESAPDWILTDDMLGEMLTGLQVAHAVEREHPAVFVALVTGNTEPVRLTELRSSGYPVIVKPATPERLIALLAQQRAVTPAAPRALAATAT